MAERSEPPRTLLEQMVRDGDHTLEELCAQFDAVARDAAIPATLSRRQLQRWIAREVDNARPPARRVASQLWGRPFQELLGPPDAAVGVVGSGPSPAVPAVVLIPPAEPGGDTDWPGAARVAASIAHESMRHAAGVCGRIEDMTIEQAQAEALRLARDYTAMAPLAILAEARRTRDLVYALLEQTRRPHQTGDLYLVAGQLCALMAAASFDLAAWDASEEQARAAYVYGELVGHPGLRCWTRGHQALIAYWTGRPRHAVDLAEAGLAEAAVGSPTARLHGIAARAWSHMGNAAATRTAIVTADTAREVSGAPDHLHDEIGGEFGWGPSRHAACVGSALVEIGDGHAAAQRIRGALRLLPDDPLGGLLAEQAYCDLANAELVRSDIDAAADALRPVWQLPAPQRSEGVTGRLTKSARLLGAKRWQSDRQAAGVREQIVMFNAEASARALPASTA